MNAVTASTYCRSLHDAYLENMPPTSGDSEGPSKLVYKEFSFANEHNRDGRPTAKNIPIAVLK